MPNLVNGIFRILGRKTGATTSKPSDYAVVSTEADGELRIVFMGHDGSSLQRVLTETTRELRIVVAGKDSGGTVDPLRTNPNQQLQVEVVDGGSNRIDDPIIVPATEGILLNIAGSATDVYEVIATFVNVDGNQSTFVSAGVDVAGGGALTTPEYFIRDAELTVGSSITRTVQIGGDDVIRGIAGTANIAAAHFRVRQLNG